MNRLRTWLLSVAGLAGFLLLSYAGIKWVLPVLIPFILAAVLAELVNPLVDWLAGERQRGKRWRWHIPRGLAVALVLGMAAGTLGLVITLAIARLVAEITALAQSLPYYYAVLLDLSNRAVEELGAVSKALPESVQSLIHEALAQSQNVLRTLLPSVAGTLKTFAGLPLLVTEVLVTLIATFFISRDRRPIGRFLLELLPGDMRPKVQDVKDRVWTSAMGFAKAQLLLVSITMVLTTTGLLVIGAEYAVLAGLLVGVADILPLVGPALIYLPWVAFQFVTGHAVFGVKLLLLYGLNAGIRQFLETKLVADETGLHPLATLLSIYLGFQFFGALGFVVGPLLAILLKAVVQSGLLPIFQNPDK